MGVAVDHIIRLVLRIHVGAYRREADVAVPAGSSVGEILEELTTLMEAPRISRAWQAMSATGTPIDLATPLATTGLAQGDVLVLTPHSEHPRVVVRDAAEALSDRDPDAPGHGPRINGGVAFGSLVGVAGFLLLACAPPIKLAPPLGLGIAALLVLVIISWRRDLRSLGSCFMLLCAASAATYVLGESTKDVLSWAWAISSAAGFALVAVIPLIALGVAGPRQTTALAIASMHFLLAAITVALSGRLLAGAGFSVALGLVMVSMIPRLAALLAGLKVPTLPSAGQDLAVADVPDPQVTGKARRALDLQAGLHVGNAAATAVGLIIIAGISGGPFTQALGLCACIAVLFHALRHRGAIATWSLGILGAVALGCSLWAVISPEMGHILQFVIGALCAMGCLTLVLWAPLLKNIQPTTIVWLERSETLALAACLPLAAHVAGLFSSIRGLG